MHITYECTQVQRQIVDFNILGRIKDKAHNIEMVTQHLQSLQDRVNALESEKYEVVKVSAKFSCFLKHNATAPFNDAMSDYIDHLIQVEKRNVRTCFDRSRLVGLQDMKRMYEEELKILEQAIEDVKSGVRVPTAGAIKRLYNHLCHLEITGPMLKNAMSVADVAGIGTM